MKTLNLFIILLCMLATRSVHAQLVTIPSTNPNTLANTIVGPGITVSGAMLNCPTGASGTFANGTATMIGIDNGVILASGAISNAIGPNNSPNTSTDYNAPGDPHLSALIGNTPTHDRCVLEFNFEAIANQVSISFVFGSEEYLEYVNSAFNDVFGFLVSGPNPAGGTYTNFNIATIPTNVPVAVNTINLGSNPSYFINNPQSTNPMKIEYDGYTVVITSTLDIIPCETYHFKLGIADATDEIYDSGVFLGEASFEASLDCRDVTLTLGPDGTGTVTPEELIASDLDECDFTFTLSQSEFVCSDEGDNTVTVTADDGNGTVLTCEATVTVVVPEGILTVDLSAECTTVYPGYGTGCTDITATVSGGTEPYGYEWSNGGTTETITVCPTEETDYYVTVTDANGCSEVAGPVTVMVVEVSCGNNNNKVMVCHNGDNPHTLCISPSAVPAHLAHGDFLGPCSATSNPCTAGNGLAIIPQFYQPDEDNPEPVIWPVPGGNELNIKLPSGVTGAVLVELRTTTGQTLKSVNIAEGSTYASFSELNVLAEGIYYIRIQDFTGSLWTVKWMKN